MNKERKQNCTLHECGKPLGTKDNFIGVLIMGFPYCSEECKELERKLFAKELRAIALMSDSLR